MTVTKPALLLGASLLASCYGGSYTQDSDTSTQSGTAKTKGQLINECMTTGAPEECDSKINRRRTSY